MMLTRDVKRNYLCPYSLCLLFSTSQVLFYEYCRHGSFVTEKPGGELLLNMNEINFLQLALGLDSPLLLYWTIGRISGLPVQAQVGLSEVGDPIIIIRCNYYTLLNSDRSKGRVAVWV